MEKEYSIHKLSGKLKAWQRRKFIISQDDFRYYENETHTSKHLFHISELIDITINKTDEITTLTLHSNNSQTLTITIKDDNKQLEELNDMLVIIKRKYNIFIVQRLYMKDFSEKFNPNELKKKIDLYITDSMYQEIYSMLKKHEEISDNSIVIWRKMQELILDATDDIEKYDDNDKKPFKVLPDNLDEEYDDDEEEKSRISLEELERFTKYYKTLIRLLATIKMNQIEYRFKRSYVINDSCMRYRLNKDFNLVDYDQQSNIISMTQIESINNDNNQGNDNSSIKGDNNIKALTKQEQIEVLKEENKRLRNKFFESLNKHSKKKEKLKRCIISSNCKVYYCHNCGNILNQTDSETPTCLYDSLCTKNSLFHCKKCKINFCTYCILYQRNSKCSKNHRLFPSKTKDVCLLCNNTDSNTYFVCQHCNIAVCALCMGERQTKEFNCWNCNMELTWRKEVYAKCNKCSNVKECFWGCTNCDYSLCLKCVQTNQGLCGAAHKLIQFDIDANWRNKPMNYNTKLMQNFYMTFTGKCMKCDNNIEKNVYACLRCAYFICRDCN